MKKITLSLLMAVSCVSLGFGQASISIEAPLKNANYLDLLPMGLANHANYQAVYLVSQTELASLTGTAVTSMGLQLTDGTTGVSVTGNVTVSLVNTTNSTYQKGTSFTAALVGMTAHFTNTITIPAANGASTINLNFPNTFTYTGGGIYIAFKWSAPGPFPATTQTNACAWAANTGTTGTNMAAFGTSSLGVAIADAITELEQRPCFLFRASNTATNELGITKLEVPGKLSKLAGSGHEVIAEVRNSSTIAKTNIVVSLNVGGSNSFSDTKTISSLAPGAVGSVTFAMFTPTMVGTNDFTASIVSDDNLLNNTYLRSQTVTCNTAALNPIGAIGSGVGFGTSGVFSTKITPAVNASLTAARIAIATNAANAGKSVYAVLLDNTGAQVATSNTVVLTAAMLGAFRTFSFTPAEPLASGSDYYVGLAQPSGGHYPMGTIYNYYQPKGYYTGPLAGTALPTPVVTQGYGFFGIEPIYSFDATTLNEITTSLAANVMCKGESVTLTAQSAGSADSFTWSATTGAGTLNVGTIVSTPAITTNTAGTGNIVLSVTGKDPATGCVTNTVAKTLSISACTGLMSYETAANISVYPNPSVNGKTMIRGLDGIATVTVLNTLGQVVLTYESKGGDIEIDLVNQPKGNYFVKIADENNQVTVKKLINQ